MANRKPETTQSRAVSQTRNIQERAGVLPIWEASRKKNKSLIEL